MSTDPTVTESTLHNNMPSLVWQCSRLFAALLLAFSRLSFSFRDRAARLSYHAHFVRDFYRNFYRDHWMS